MTTVEHAGDKAVEAERGADCTQWCIEEDHFKHDPACWGTEYMTPLSLEEGYAHDAVDPRLFDPPRISTFAYRREPGRKEVVYFHLYRNHDNDHLSVDASVHLTPDEAVKAARALLNAADDVTHNAETVPTASKPDEAPPTVWYGSAPQFDARVSRTEANYLDATRKFVDSAQFYLGEIVDDLPGDFRLRGQDILDRLDAAMAALESLQAAAK